MSRLSKTLFLISLLLFMSLGASTARPEPVHPNDSSPLNNQHQADGDQEDVNEETNCEGVGGDECLMRRTLIAHTDYIYTQKKKD
ncbi:hypothetical protein C5167_024578 [Papaver somniferum]|uniref:Phytosulfokine n=1 Tax=Papaver somniferum TaxID=3469 RepID=A0A4Y7JNY4_PAPSO|nr:phytosulfokines-like [Papaver somniferum]RZC62803.1 hypothetical protein C5167_024578 [Papaver somniferum]